MLALLLLALAFGLVERRARGGPWFAALRRPGRGTDLLWWLTGPFLTGTLTRLLVAFALVLAVLLTGGSLAAWAQGLAAGGFPDPSPFGIGAWLRARPFAVQLLLGLLASDLLGYATHRAFHRRRLWRFHAVHHSSVRLDWLAAARVHPVNEILTRPVQTLPLLLLGFSPGVFAVVAPLLTLYAVLLHADLRWSYGPLRYVIASPAFHRWHHGAGAEARDVNFAGFFPVIDLLFGTYHLPPGRLPERLGVDGPPVPEGWWAQLVWPFRRVRRAGPSG